eukprot:3194497-Karenia_brevis.AAC.1
MRDGPLTVNVCAPRLPIPFSGVRAALGRKSRHRGVYWKPRCPHCGQGCAISTHKTDMQFAKTRCN